MGYKLDAVNIDKDGDYVFVSKNGRIYHLANCYSFPTSSKNESAFDIVVIFDFAQPWDDGSGKLRTAVVNYFYGTDIGNLDCARDYVNEYEKKNRKLLFGNKITQNIIDALNEELVAKGCLFRYAVDEVNDDGSINTIQRVLPDDTWIDSYIINATDDFYIWFENFFRSYGIELNYNNTRSICWAKK